MRRTVVVALLLACACREKPASPPPPAVVVSTSATNDLAQALAAAFERQSGRKLVVRLVRPQDIANTPGAAAIFRETDVTLKQARLRSVFAYVDFYIVGPSRDPAHVARTKSADGALQSIAKHHRRFCGPVDFAVPVTGGVPCHGTPQEVLATASRLGDYTIASDVSKLPRGYKVLLRDVPPLHTAYVVALLPGPANRDAEWFVEWVMSYRGREAVESLHLRSEH